jgi:hypothetical protein
MESGLTLDVMATPDAPVIDAQPQATPELEAQQSELVQQPAQDEYPIQLSTGAKYRSVEELIAAKEEQDRYLRDVVHPTMRQQPPPPPPQPVVEEVDQYELSVRSTEIRKQMIAKGFQDNPEYAELQAFRELQNEKSAEKRAEGVVQKFFVKQQAVAEYDALKAANPELSLDNPVSRFVYEQHAPKNAIEHLALVKYYSSQQQAAPAQRAPLPQNVRGMFQPAQQQRQQQFAQPATSVAQTPQSEPAGLQQALEDIEISLTRLYGNVSPERMATAKQGVRDRWTARQSTQANGR